MVVVVVDASTPECKSPLEAGKQLLDNAVKPLPSILQTPFETTGQAVLSAAHVAYSKAAAVKKLTATTHIPKSCRSSFKLSATAILQETTDWTALQQEAQKHVEDFEKKNRELVLRCANLEFKHHNKHLEKLLIKAIHHLATVYAIAETTKIPAAEHPMFRALVLSGMYTHLSTAEVFHEAPATRADFLNQAHTITGETIDSDWFAQQATWTSSCQRCVTTLINVLLRPMTRMVECGKSLETAKAVAKHCETVTLGTATADAVMAADNDPTITPAVMKQMIKDAVDAAIKKKSAATGRTGRKQQQQQPSKSKSKSNAKPSSGGAADDDSHGGPPRSNKRGGSSNLNTNRSSSSNHHSTKKSTSTAAAAAGNGTRGASPSASSKKKTGNKNQKVDDGGSASSSGTGTKRRAKSKQRSQ